MLVWESLDSVSITWNKRREIYLVFNIAYFFLHYRRTETECSPSFICGTTRGQHFLILLKNLSCRYHSKILYSNLFTVNPVKGRLLVIHLHLHHFSHINVFFGDFKRTKPLQMANNY